MICRVDGCEGQATYWLTTVDNAVLVLCDICALNAETLGEEPRALPNLS